MRVKTARATVACPCVFPYEKLQYDEFKVVSVTIKGGNCTKKKKKNKIRFLCAIFFCIQQTKRYAYGCKEIIQTEMFGRLRFE